jgi:hypothetical protein
MATWKWTGDIVSGTTGQKVATGTGSPEGAVTAPVGSLYMRSDGGTDTSMSTSRKLDLATLDGLPLLTSGGGGGSRTGTIAYVIDGGGSVPTTGVKGQSRHPSELYDYRVGDHC